MPDRVVEQIRHWRDELLNLSRRARVLYYKPTKTASLRIEAPGTEKVIDVLRGGRPRHWSFFHPPERDQAEPENEDRSLEALKADWRPGPDELVTNKPDSVQIERALRALERRTTQEFMDKGIWVLYLAVGFLEWSDPDTGDDVLSPLVLIPISLQRSSPRDPVRLVLADEDPVVNPALAVRMESEFSIRLPQLPELEDLDIYSFLADVETAAHRSKAGRTWSVADHMVIDVFSFHKEAMYRDLKDNESAVVRNEVIRALALGADADVDLSFSPADQSTLDDDYPPEDLATIMDADASQRRCIVASREGRSFVMDGPPGTGKSQTISNIIAQALLDRKTVLFVSEKIAALEVVKARLDDVGLGEYLLELHSHKSTRKEVAKTLHRALTMKPRPSSEFGAASLLRLRSRREELNNFAAAVNEIREPLGMSLHRVLGLIAQRQALSQAPLAEIEPADLDGATWAEIQEVAGEISRAWTPVERGDEFQWRHVRTDYASAGGHRTAISRIDDALARLATLRVVHEGIADDLEFWEHDTPSAVPRTLELLRELAERPDIPMEWLTGESLEPQRKRAIELESIDGEFTEAMTYLAELGIDDWSLIDPQAVETVADATHRIEALPLPWAEVPSKTIGTLHAEQSWSALSVQQLTTLVATGKSVAKKLGIDSTELTIDRCSELADLAGLVDAEYPPEPDWLDARSIDSVRHAAEVLGVMVDSYRAKAHSLNTIFLPSVLELDLHSLQVRFQTLHTGLRKLGSAYRVDKHLLAEHTVTGKVTKETIGAIGDAIEWKEISEELRAAEKKHASTIGNYYYHGIDSQFDDLVAGVETAANALELAASALADDETFRAAIGRSEHPDTSIAVDGEALGRACASWTLDTSRIMETTDVASLRSVPLDDLIETLAAFDALLAPLLRVCDPIADMLDGEPVLRDVAEAAALGATSARLHGLVADERAEDESLLGPGYSGQETDWDSLKAHLSWAERVRELAGGVVAAETAERMLHHAVTDREPLDEAHRDWIEAVDDVIGMFDGDRASEVASDLESDYGEAAELLDFLSRSIDDIDEWAAYASARGRLISFGIRAAVEFAEQELAKRDDVVPMLERSVLEAWADWLLEDDERLAKNRAVDRDTLVEEFRGLDSKFVTMAPSRIIATVNAGRPKTALGEAGVIQREGTKKRRHMPVRDLIHSAAKVTLALKPCFMMSPLSVSQFLPPDIEFDLVVFDEASQVKPSDAANSIYRGRQLIVAGDQKQLPPTDFFSRSGDDGGDEYDEEELDEFESVLDLAKAGGMESLSLRWHYRSQHESLITFSNYSFYDGGLITFPGALAEAADVGVAMFPVNGVYRRGGARDNVVEAEKVVERVLFYAEHHPELSLGVVAFSEAQASTIEYMMDQRRRDRPELDGYFTDDRLSGFFVKNLESVQGDERDIMVFSIGYGPDEAGKVTMNFGPLNRQGGWRRLNVAITRARRRVEVVTSILPEQFQPTSSEGPRHLKRYLDFAQRGVSALAIDFDERGGDAESPFEEEVVRQIRSWGYEARPQVGVASYRIDIGVIDPTAPGRYVLGVECDGAMYHSSRVARDRDRLRLEVLEGLDWTIHRIWGTAWYRNRDTEIERLRAAIEAAASGGRGTPLGSGVPTRPEVKLEAVDLDTRPDWVTEYRICKPRVPSRTPMQDAQARRSIAEAIRDVVAVEGPVSKEVVLTRVRKAWGLGRSGSQVRAAFDRALLYARKFDVQKDRRHFLRIGDPPVSVPVRIPSEDSETVRHISEIPIEERRTAILNLVNDARRIEWDQLSEGIARLFGWSRRGATIQDEIDKDIRACIRNGLLHSDGNLLTLADGQIGVDP